MIHHRRSADLSCDVSVNDPDPKRGMKFVTFVCRVESDARLSFTDFDTKKAEFSSWDQLHALPV